MNLPYEGGGFRFAPEASVTDGCIDIVIAHHMSPLKAVWLLPRAFFGKHTGAKELRSFGVLRYRLRRSEAFRSIQTERRRFPDIRHRWRYWKKIAYHCRITAGKFIMFPKCFMKKVVVHFKSCYNRCNRKDLKDCI